VALEHDEDLLLRRVAVHGAVELAGRDVRVVEPGLHGAGGGAELARAVAELAAVEDVELDLDEPDDVRRTLARVRELRLGQGALELPLVPEVDVEERRADPDLLDAREPGVAGSPLPSRVPVGEHVEAARARDERVRRPGRMMDEAGTGFDLADDVVALVRALPRQARAVEHEEDLLVVAVRVERRRAAARMDTNAVDADADRAGGLAEVPPAGVDASHLVVVLLDVVPVGDVGMAHVASIRGPAASAQRLRAVVLPFLQLVGEIVDVEAGRVVVRVDVALTVAELLRARVVSVAEHLRRTDVAALADVLRRLLDRDVAR